MINTETQQRIINYFARIDGMKPSEFYKSFFKEWHYLTVLKDLVLKDIETSVENGADFEKKVTQSGLLDEVGG